VEHRAFLQSLTGEQRQSLTKRNNRDASVRLLVLVACFIFCSTAILQRLPLLPVWLTLQGMLLVSLFHLLHESVHDTVFRQRLPNRLLAHVCGFVLFLPAIWFRYFHHAHHRYTQQENDPELASEKPNSLMQWLVHVSGVTIWRYQLALLLSAVKSPVIEHYLKEKHQSSARLEMLIMLLVYLALIIASVLFGSTVLLYLWIVPLLVGQPFLRLYLLAEHTGCESGSNMFRNTRTVLTNPIVRWFTWNMPYHTEHHVYPSVPFHQLPKLHCLMNAYLVEVDASYTQFNARFVKQLSTASSE